MSAAVHYDTWNATMATGSSECARSLAVVIAAARLNKHPGRYTGARVTCTYDHVSYFVAYQGKSFDDWTLP